MLSITLIGNSSHCWGEQEYHLEHADIWFIRFSLDFHCKYLAVGNRMGKVFVYDVEKSTEPIQRLGATGLKSAVRPHHLTFTN
jgi:polycomb protein EED